MNILQLEKYKPLTSQQALQLQKQYGKNIIVNRRRNNPLVKIFKQLISPLILLLIIVGTFSLAAGESDDALFIYAMVVINIVVTYIQESRAEKGLSALKEMLSPQAKVFRDKEILVIDSGDIVVGDIILLDAGDRVPADGIILEEAHLSINESQLTGESLPVEKDIEKNNQVFMSTFVAGGTGVMRVTEIGMHTKIGEITKEVTEKAFDITPIEQKISKLTKYVIIAITILFIMLVGIALLRGETLENTLPSAIAFAISSTPESLPIILLLTLSIGAYRMQKKNVILRNLPSTATLAGVDVICTDKTGTLTEGKLSVIKTYLYENKKFSEDKDIDELITYAVLCNSAEITSKESIGDLLDIAILEFAGIKKFDFKNLRENSELLSEVPFDSEHKFQATLHKLKGKKDHVISVKGAVENVVKLCKLSSAEISSVLEKEVDLASHGYKVIALASETTELKEIEKNKIKNLEFKGMIVFADVLRPNVKEMIVKVQNSGVRVIMTTGDQLNAAKHIAKEIGIMSDQDSGSIVNGSDYKSFKGKLTAQELQNLAIVGRSTPGQKFDLVEMLQQQGYTVAMTGDGVNDGPALVKADIGISMGKGGTDVARESSDMVLVDNNFESIVSGVEEARVVFENIRKVITYLFSTAVGESIVILFGLIATGHSPLTATQILFLNLATDGALDLALAGEKKEHNIIEFKPKRYKEEILTKKFVLKIALIGGMMGYSSLIVTQGYQTGNVIYDQSAVLVFLTVIQWFITLSIRTTSVSLFKAGLFSNFAVWLVIILSAGLLLIVTNLPFAQRFLNTTPVGIEIWVLSALCGLTIIFLEELRKKFKILI